MSDENDIIVVLQCFIADTVSVFTRLMDAYSSVVSAAANYGTESSAKRVRVVCYIYIVVLIKQYYVKSQSLNYI